MNLTYFSPEPIDGETYFYFSTKGIEEWEKMENYIQISGGTMSSISERQYLLTKLMRAICKKSSFFCDKEELNELNGLKMIFHSNFNILLAFQVKDITSKLVSSFIRYEITITAFYLMRV